MASRRDWTVVGVSGVTCSGKTTLASALHAAFPGSVIINQDTYFHPPDDARHTPLPDLNHVNWEIITALDMAKMITDIKEILARPAPVREVGVPLLIIEGFLIFTDPYISSICEHKLFLTLTYEECWARRNVRTYDPADVPGYFDQVVWPEYQKYLGFARDAFPDVKLIPGSSDIQSIIHDYCLILTENLNLKTC